MSHELRTPLNAIIGFSDLLAEKTAGPLTAKQERFIGHVRNGARHLLQLINDILDLSKIESGLLELRREDFSLSMAMPEVLSIIRPLAMAKKIHVEHSSADFSVYADRVRFKQILYNLLSNAVKFTPEGGRVRVECSSDGKLVCANAHRILRLSFRRCSFQASDRRKRKNRQTNVRRGFSWPWRGAE